MKKWKEEYIDLIISITDDDYPEFREDLISTGTKREDIAKELTAFIKENNITCHNVWKNIEEYRKYEKLANKEMEICKREGWGEFPDEEITFHFDEWDED